MRQQHAKPADDHVGNRRQQSRSGLRAIDPAPDVIRIRASSMKVRERDRQRHGQHRRNATVGQQRQSEGNFHIFADWNIQPVLIIPPPPHA
jgi:hypothetical protein